MGISKEAQKVVDTCDVNFLEMKDYISKWWCSLRAGAKFYIILIVTSQNNI